MALKFEDGKVHRVFTEEWSNSGFINLDKLPEMVGSLVSQKQSMMNHIKECHDLIDKIVDKHHICTVAGCLKSNCTSDHS